MKETPWLITQTHWKSVKKISYATAVLPWGAVEPHNYHLPYGTDLMQCEYVAAEAGRLAWEKGAAVAILPAVPFGVQTGMLDLPFALNMNPSTQYALLADIAKTIERQGVKNLVILNGHGGNDFRSMIRELQPEVTPFLCLLDWYRAADANRFFDDPGDHAGELETSVMMALEPGLVHPLGEAGPGSERRPRLEAMKKGWAWAPRPWSSITADTGVGNPRLATASKGAAFLKEVTANIADFLAELSVTDRQDLYESVKDNG